MKNPKKQNHIDISEDTTVPNTKAKAYCKPDSDIKSSEKTKKIAKNKPMLVSTKDSDITPLDVPYTQGL